MRMDKLMDKQVAKKQFDSAQFEKNVQASMKTLDKWKSSLNLEKEMKGFAELTSLADKVSFDKLSSSVERLSKQFAEMGAIEKQVSKNFIQSMIQFMNKTHAFNAACKSMKNMNEQFQSENQMKYSFELLPLVNVDGAWKTLEQMSAILGGVTSLTILYGKIVDKDTSQSIKYTGDMFNNMSGAVSVISDALGQLSGLSNKEIEQGLQNMFSIGMLFGVFIGVSALGGKNTDKTGSMFLHMSEACKTIGEAIQIINGFSIGDLKKGVKIIAGFEVLFTAMVAVSKIAGDNSDKAGSMMKDMSHAIMMMVNAIALLNLMDEDDVIRGTACIVSLGAMFALLLSVSSNTGKSTGTVLLIAGVVAGLAGIVYLLSGLPAENAIGAATALSELLIAFSLSLKILEKIDGMNAYGSIVFMTGIVGALGGILYLLQGMPMSSAIGAATSLSILLLALSGATATLSNVDEVSIKAIGAIAAMTLVIGALGYILSQLQELHPEAALGIATSLSELILALSAACVILEVAGIGGTAVLYGVAGLIALVSSMGLLMAGIGALIEWIPDLQNFVEHAIPILGSIGEGIGSFFGGLVAGLAGEILELIPALGESLSQFAVNLEPFLAMTNNLDSAKMAGVESLAKAILCLTAANLIDGVTRFLGFGSSDLESFGGQLGAFGKGIANFSKEIEENGGIDSEAVQAAADAGAVIAQLKNSLPREGGWFGTVFGNQDLEEFGNQMVYFGAAVCHFSNTIEENGGINDNAVQAAANAGTLIANLKNSLPKEGGWFGSVFGDQDLISFGNQMVYFGAAVCKFSNTIEENGGINQDAVQAAASAGMIIAKLKTALPTEGGWFGTVFGEQDLAKFGEQMVSFGSAVCDFSNTLMENGGIDMKAVQSAANAGAIIANLQEKLPDGDSWVSDFFGGSKESLSDFGEDLKAFGVGIVEFSNIAADIQFESAIHALDFARQMIDFVNLLNEDSFDIGILDSFDISALGEAIKNYYGQLSDIEPEKLTVSVDSAMKLVALVSSMKDLDLKAISNFKIDQIGLAIQSYAGYVTEIDPYNVVTSVMAAQKLVDLVKSTSGMDTNGVPLFVDAVNNLGQITANQVLESLQSAYIAGFNSDVFVRLAQVWMDHMMTGMKGRELQMKLTIGSILISMVEYMKEQNQNFYQVGAYLVAGFAKGIDETTYKVEAKASAMARRAAEAARKELDEHSPSRVFYKIGAFAGKGFINALTDYGLKAYHAGTDLVNQAHNGLSKAISHVVSAIHLDMDATPTITPVLDLSDVSSGAGTIGRMLRMSPSIGLMNNVTAIDAMMNASHRNTNQDVVSAIHELKNTFGNFTGNTYHLGNITYDDGSSISAAVKELIRAAKIERRM